MTALFLGLGRSIQAVRSNRRVPIARLMMRRLPFIRPAIVAGKGVVVRRCIQEQAFYELKDFAFDRLHRGRCRLGGGVMGAVREIHEQIPCVTAG